MDRYFVRVTPALAANSHFFLVWAEDYGEAALLAAGESGFGPEELCEYGSIAVSQECIPIPGETPRDLRYVPLNSVMPDPWGCRDRPAA
jgi:hypothetical protein